MGGWSVRAAVETSNIARAIGKTRLISME